MSSSELTSVAYKKGNWMRYTLWAFAGICIAVLISTLITILNGEISSAIPQDYTFSITDNYTEGSNIRTTYYVYPNRILVENESFRPDSVNRSVMIYDGILTDTLIYNPDDKIEVCELGVCLEKPRILVTIKTLISRQIGREYLGL